MKLIFWMSVSVVLYTFLVYPLVLVVLASLFQLSSDLRFALGRGNRRGVPVSDPLVSMIIPAHNEAGIIAGKMRNCAELDYPKSRLEILVGCDGCTDDTVERIRESCHSNVRIFDSAERSGKPAMLNRLVPEARGEILLFSDANTLYNPESVRSLVRRFAAPGVGAVCGELKLLAPDGKTATEGLYWRYECFLKILESRLNMLVGANGAIFAIRRDLYRPLPAGTINDDFLIAMDIRRQGFSVVYDPEANAFEETSTVQQEFRRRIRIGSGDLRALRQTWTMLSPLAGSVALSYWSHKICRWLVPLALITSFVSAVWLSRDVFYLGCALLGLLLVASAGFGYFLQVNERRPGVFGVPCHFLAMNLALLIGFAQDLFGSRTGVWAPTARIQKIERESSKADMARV